MKKIYYVEDFNGTYWSSDKTRRFQRLEGKNAYHYLKEPVNRKKRFYKYYDENEWKNYEFRFVKRFSNEDTRQWKAQNYLYTIQLVAGTKSRDYLINILDDNNVNYVKNIDYIGELTPNDTSIEELYNLAISNGLQLTENFHLDAPIIPSYTTSILKPTKITVKEYAQGDVIW